MKLRQVQLCCHYIVIQTKIKIYYLAGQPTGYFHRHGIDGED